MDALVFDFDGTIVDSEPLHGRALAEVCAGEGVRVEPGHYVGHSDADALIAIFRAAGRPLNEQHLEQLLASKVVLMQSYLARDLFVPYPGAIELAHAARLRSRIGVCSAAIGSEVRYVLSRLGLDAVMGAIVTADEVGATKPDPEGYLLTAEQLRADPRKCIAIEDSVTGIAAARAAGYKVVAVGHTTPRERLREAHLFVDRISDLSVAQLEELTA